LEIAIGEARAEATMIEKSIEEVREIIDDCENKQKE
jgi:hypothetical protein